MPSTGHVIECTARCGGPERAESHGDREPIRRSRDTVRLRRICKEAGSKEAAMSLRVTEVVIDCADHGRVVDFWAAALGYERRKVNEQYVALVPPAREPGLPPLLFQKVPEPKTVKNRVHLDFRAEVMADEVARLVALGATVIAERRLGDFAWTVLADPEGNELCVSGD
jgi:predicted enzyme related to lactoylglutathione lyase